MAQGNDPGICCGHGGDPIRVRKVQGNVARGPARDGEGHWEVEGVGEDGGPRGVGLPGGGADDGLGSGADDGPSEGVEVVPSARGEEHGLESERHIVEPICDEVRVDARLDVR